MRRLLQYAVVAFAIASGLWAFLPRPPLLDGVPFSTVIRDRNGAVLDVTLADDDRYRIFTPLARISPRLLQATLDHEDRFFGTHPGVNPVSLVRAAWHWATGPEQGGASTITMQLARLRFRLNTTSWSGKLRQIWIALCLERHYSKSEILEAYFNLAPYGGNVEGIGAAAWKVLGRDADSLSWPEAVAFAVIPQSPARRAPRSGRANPDLDAAFRRLYAKLLAEDVVSDALGLEFQLCTREAGPPVAPHFMRRFSTIEVHDVRTTLDVALQDIVARNVRQHVASLATLDVHNAAALLVDASTMDVLASVGSAGFFNAKIQGQVDGTRSRRSPGSALKPFIYALAIDEGLIVPSSLLADAPRRYSGYNPENFDREFCGPIPASAALVRSRNVPAVDLAARLARPDLFEFLKGCGVDLPLSQSKYGLALALGGGEVTMEELVRLYCALANDGRLQDLHLTMKGDQPSHDRRVISPEASFLTLDMLAEAPRPFESEPTRSVAWKTGTSHGFRDAWAVGVFDHYVLAVWIGNFDGKGNPAFVGRSCAGPLLFRIIDAMAAGGRARLSPFAAPKGCNLRRVDFCAVSGQLPGDHCDETRSGWFIPGVSPIRRCDVHREILVDRTTGLRVTRDDGSCRREVFECWPSNLLKLFDEAGLARRTPPPFRPDSGIEIPSRSGNAPRILSPSGTAGFAAGESGIPLVATADAGVKRIYWFSDQTFLGCTAPGECLGWRAPPGRHTLLALDDNGRSAQKSFDVRATFAVASRMDEFVVGFRQ